MPNSLDLKLGFVSIIARVGWSYWIEPDRKRVWHRRKQIFFMYTRRPAIVSSHAHVLVVEMNLHGAMMKLRA